MKPNDNLTTIEPDTVELVSALADDHLEGREREAALAALDEHDHLRERWQRYHLIGDLIRGEATPAPRPEPAFDLASRVRAELEEEPYHTAPVVELAARRRPRFTPAGVGWAMAASGVLAAVLLVATRPFDGLAPGRPMVAERHLDPSVKVLAARDTVPRATVVEGEWERLDERELTPYLVNHHAYSARSSGFAVPASVRIVSGGAP